MRIKFCSLCALLVAALGFTSCLSSDDEEVTLYSDTAITSFYISTAKIYSTTTSSTGGDSTYYTTNSSMSDYPFYINQLSGEIYNTDSLPSGTDLTKLLCSYGSKNSGLVYIENLAGDSLKYLSTTDSTDFSAPRYLRVYATDGSGYRRYTVTVNKHKEEANTFAWNAVATNDNFKTATGLKAVDLLGSPLVFCSDGSSTTVYSSAQTDGATWNAVYSGLGSEAYKNVASVGDVVYVLDNGTLMKTTDGTNYTTINSTNTPSRLLGASMTQMFGLSADGTLMVSTDNGQTWQADDVDSGKELLPTSDITLCTTAYSGVDNADYVVLAGNRELTVDSASRNAVVWTKIVERDDNSETNSWNYIETDSVQQYALPRLADLNVFAYGDRLIAYGGAGMGKCTKAAYSAFYDSRDGGITWKHNATYDLPSTFDTTTTTTSAVVDSNNRIWIVCAGSGQVWRGKLNSIDW